MKDRKTNIKNKSSKAVALAYFREDSAPKVVAKGQGLVAEKIIEKAKEEDIYIYEDEKLVESLIDLEVNEEIPEQLYEAVAEIIFYIYNLDIQKGKTYE